MNTSSKSETNITTERYATTKEMIASSAPNLLGSSFNELIIPGLVGVAIGVTLTLTIVLLVVIVKKRKLKSKHSNGIENTSSTQIPVKHDEIQAPSRLADTVNSSRNIQRNNSDSEGDLSLQQRRSKANVSGRNTNTGTDTWSNKESQTKNAILKSEAIISDILQDKSHVSLHQQDKLHQSAHKNIKRFPKQALLPPGGLKLSNIKKRISQRCQNIVVVSEKQNTVQKQASIATFKPLQQEQLNGDRDYENCTAKIKNKNVLKSKENNISKVKRHQGSPSSVKNKSVSGVDNFLKGPESPYKNVQSKEMNSDVQQDQLYIDMSAKEHESSDSDDGLDYVQMEDHLIYENEHFPNQNN